MASTEIKSAPALITGAYQTRIASVWRKHRSLGLTILSLILGFAGWPLLSTFFFSPLLVPPPVRVIKAAIPMILSGEIFRDVMISLSRVFVGFLAGSVTAILLGVILGRISILQDLVDPIVELLRYLSPTSQIPIAVIWCGIGEMSKYFLIFWGTFFIMLVNTTAGVLRTPIARQRAAQCLGASQLEIFAYIVVPSAVPYIITGMRVAMASAVMSIIPAEILAADSGIGYLLQNSSMLLQTDRIFVALLTISVLGFLCDRALRQIVDLTLTRFMVPN